MKRFLAVNKNNTAVAVSGDFSKCVDLVADETERGDLIYAFDIETNICYAYQKVGNGYGLIEGPTPFKEFELITYGETPSELYKHILSKII